MTVIIGGTGTANGITSFSSPAAFGGTLATASGGIAISSLPAGSVVQHYVTQLTAGSLALSGVSLTGISSATSTEMQSFTITPILSNSRFLFEFLACIDSNTNGIHEQIGMFVGSTVIGASWWYRRVSGSEPQQHAFSGSYTASGSSSFTLSVRAQSGNLGETIYWGRTASYTFGVPTSSLTVTEVRT